MRLQDLMTRPVETVAPDESAEKALTRMETKGIHHLVVQANGKVLGVVSARDLAGPKGHGAPRGKSVGELMTANAVCARATTTVRQAANLLRGRTIGCLPVVDEEGRVEGIVTTTDLLEALGQGRQPVPPSQSKKRQSRGAGPRLGREPGRHAKPQGPRPRA